MIHLSRSPSATPQRSSFSLQAASNFEMSSPGCLRNCLYKNLSKHSFVLGRTFASITATSVATVALCASVAFAYKYAQSGPISLIIALACFSWVQRDLVPSRSMYPSKFHLKSFHCLSKSAPGWRGFTSSTIAS